MQKRDNAYRYHMPDASQKNMPPALQNAGGVARVDLPQPLPNE